MSYQSKSKRWGSMSGLVIAVITVLMVAPAGAAAGNHGTATGSGQEVDIDEGGTDFASSTNPFCLEVRGSVGSSYLVDLSGVFSAEDTGTVVEYNGDASLAYATTETYYISPQGIYTGLWVNPVTMETECDPATLGGSVAVTVSIQDPSSSDAAGVTCSAVSGTYSRVNTVVTVIWSGSCTVDGDGTAGSEATGTVSHTFTGNFDPLSGITGAWVYA